MKTYNMNSLKNLLSLSLLWLLTSIGQHIQAQVNVQIRIVPPYLSRVSDYASRPDLMMVTLTNTSRNTLQVQLHGSITGDNGVSAIVKDSYRSPQAVELGPLETKNLNANDIVSLFNPNTITYTGISAADINRGFILPEGTYSICVRALDYDSHEPLSPEEPIGCTQFNISNVEPPTIVSPANEQELSSLGPQAFPITWSMPPGASPATQYHVRIVEMLTPRNPNDAMQSATTPAFFERTVQGNTLLYGPADPQLTPGRQYALMVQAEDPFNSVTYRNGGKSEVYTFTYAQTEGVQDAQVALVKGDSLIKYPTTVKGRLQYRFSESPESGLFPVANQQVYLEKVFAEVSYENGKKVYKPLSNSTAVPVSREIMDSQPVTTDAAGNFELTASFLAQDSAGVIAAETWDRGAKGLGGIGIYLLSNVRNNLEGKLAITYRIAVDNPHYKVSENYMDIKPGGVYGMADNTTAADVVLEANSYTLAVNVREVFNNIVGKYAGNQEIRIYRRAVDRNNANLGIPQYEGDLTPGATAEEAGGNVLIASRKTPAPAIESENPQDYTIYFPRLFRSVGAASYDYQLCLVNGGIVVKNIVFNDLASLVQTQKAATASTNNTVAGSNSLKLSGSITPLASSLLQQKPTSSPVIKSTLPTMLPTGKKGTPTAANLSSGSIVDLASKQPSGLLANEAPDMARQPTRSVSNKWMAYAYKNRPDTAALTLDLELVSPPRSRLTGQLQYAFKNTPGAPQQPYANMPVKLMVFYISTETPPSSNTAAVNNQPANSNSNLLAGQGAANQILSGIAPRYSFVAHALASQDNVGRQIVNQPQGGMIMQTMTLEYYKRESRNITVDGVDVTDNGKVLKTTTTDAQGNFTFDFDNADSTNITLDGATMWRGHGDLYSSSQGKVKRVYRVVPDVPYYCAPDDNITVQPWEDQDCGTLVSFVNTYTLEVELSGNAYNNNTLTAFPDVPIRIYRPPFYPYTQQLPSLPGEDIDQQVNLFNSGSQTTTGANGMIMVSYSPPYTLKREQMTALVGNKSVVTFKNMVASRSGNNDNIYIHADTSSRKSIRFFEAAGMLFPKNYVNRKTREEQQQPPTIGTPVDAAYTSSLGPLFNSELDPDRVVKAQLRVYPKATLISGRVVDNFTQLGVGGVTVSVEEKLKGPGNVSAHYDVVTDENGYFRFDNYSQYLLSYEREYAMTGGINTQYANGAYDGTILSINAPGYAGFEKDMGKLEDDTRYGLNLYQNIELKPKASGVFGYVVDAENPRQAVTARVKLKVNGRWVDTYEYSGDPYASAPVRPDNYTDQYGFTAHSLESYLSTALTDAPKAATTQQGLKPMQQGQVYQQSNKPLVKASGGIRAIKNSTTNTLTIQVDKSKAAINPIYTAAVTQFAAVNNNTSQGVKVVVEGMGLEAVGAGSGVLRPSLLGGSQRQRFDIDLPAQPDSIIVMPYDPAYMTGTFAVNAQQADQCLGEFRLQLRKHRVNVEVRTTDGVRVPGAIVSIDGANQEQQTGADGKALFTFINNSTDNFTIRVRNGNGSNTIYFIPKTSTLNSDDDGTVQNVLVNVKPAQLLSGKVSFATNATPVQGATVFVDEGSGSASDMKATSDHNGEFQLIVPALNQGGLPVNSPKIKIRGTYSSPGKTYVGSEVELTVSGGQWVSQTTPLQLTISENADIDLSRLHGIPLRVSKLEKLPNGNYQIDGELYDIPGNANFKMRSYSGREDVLQLSGVEIKASATRNDAGIPIGVAVNDDGEPSLQFVNRELDINAFDVFNAKLEGYAGGSIDLVGHSDTSAVIYGHVRIVDNSFNFPTSYMTIANQDFYLGNYGKPNQQLMKYYIPVIDTRGYALTKFALHSVQNEYPVPISFKYLGFDGVTETSGERESFVMGDSITLFMKLSTTIKGNIKLDFNAGAAVIKHNELSTINTTEPLSFSLENWQVKSDKWHLSPQSGGIVLDKGLIQTGKIDVAFTDMQVIPGELICNSLNSANLRNNLRIGGTVNHKLNLGTDAEVLFLYDPDAGSTAGQGHYKFAIRSNTGKAAYINGLDGMTRSADRMDIQFVWLLSNGEEEFSFAPQAAPVTFYNQIAFKPEGMVSYSDRLLLTGSTNLFLPGVADNLFGEFAFFPDQSNLKGHRLEIRPFRNLTFTGAGGTKFSAMQQQNAQVFRNEGFGIAGEVTLPSGGKLQGNLVSMLTSATSNVVASDVKKQADILIGNGLLEDAAGNFAGQVGDELSGQLATARDELLGTLNEVNNSYQQVMQLGQAGQQMVNDIAGKWRLAGKGLDAINNFSNDPVGSLMQLNGVFEGFTGVDLKKEAAQKARLVAQSAIKGFQEEFPVSNMMPSGGNAGAIKDGFANMKFDFDMAAGRITGSLSIEKLDFGAASLSNIGIEMLMDRQGWYFYAGAGLNVRSVPLIFPVSAGMLIGYYPTISPELKSRVLSTAYVKKLPAIWETGQQPFSGFFFTGGKDIIPETSVGLDIGLLAFEIGAHAGFDARLYAKFGGEVNEVGVGAMLFANAYARLSVAGMAGVEGSVTAELAASGRFRVISGDVSAALQACASVTIKGRAWVGPASASYEQGIGALVSIDSRAKPPVDFSIQLGAVNCSQNPAFDY